MDIVTNVADLDYKHATCAPEEFGGSNSATLSGVMEKFAAALRLGVDGAAAWCGPGRACGEGGFWTILSRKLDLWPRERRGDAGNV